MKSKISLIAILLTLFYVDRVFAWIGTYTHTSFTEEAVSQSVLSGDFLESYLQLSGQLGTELDLPSIFDNTAEAGFLLDLIFRIGNESREPPTWSTEENTIMELLRAGSMLEDVPTPRARHHFHDPIRNTGLNNCYGGTLRYEIISAFIRETKKLYPGYWPFDMTGASALDRAKETDGYWQADYENRWSWIDARDSYYHGIVHAGDTCRTNRLSLMFIQLGHACHLLEDMGVPAHTRNDFMWGHLLGANYNAVTGVKTPLRKGGNPLEIWTEDQIGSNDGEMPSRWLNGVSPTNISKYSKLAHYWDKELYDVNTEYLGAPDSGWGLSEQTSYQFLTNSTMFEAEGVQAFPHPVKSNISQSRQPDDGRYYASGYDVNHLALLFYSDFIAGVESIPTETMWSVEDRKVYEDYAQHTVPRTINFVSGLINYFFRGRLEVEQTGYDPEEETIEIAIKNTSYHTDTDHTYALKGGDFELFWEDEDGVRTQIALDIQGTWSTSSTLEYYDEPTDSPKLTAEFEIPEGEVKQYILVYQGNINPSESPNTNDEDDPNAIAVGIFKINSGYDYICVACSSRGTIVRINTIDGSIVGEYWSAPNGRGRNPSRTTVDFCGNVWAGNRAESSTMGSVVKIGLIEGGTRCNSDGTANPSGDYLKGPFAYNTCIDQNSDGLIKTSKGLGDIRPWTNTGGADDNGGVSTAEDEAILIYARVEPTAVRHVSVDGNNNVWVGSLSREFNLLNGATGSMITGFNVGKGGYGGLVDGNGVLWSAQDMLRYDTNTGSWNSVSASTYGLAIDTNGYIWCDPSGSVYKIAPNGSVVNGFPKTISAMGFGRGLAVTPADNNVWIADSSNGIVIRLDNNGNFIKSISVGSSPTGVAADTAGKMWVTNQGSNNVMRIDPNAGADGYGEVDLTVDLGAGAGPYNYSDMTGVSALYTHRPY